MMAKILRSVDCGKTTGIYLIVLGAVVIVSTIFRGISQATLDLDPSPVLLFLGGYFLIKYNKTARKWVIGISLVGAIAVIIFAILIPFIGTNNVTVDLLFFDIKAPSLATAPARAFGPVGQAARNRGAWAYTRPNCVDAGPARENNIIGRTEVPRAVCGGGIAGRT